MGDMQRQIHLWLDYAHNYEQQGDHEPALELYRRALRSMDSSDPGYVNVQAAVNYLESALASVNEPLVLDADPPAPRSPVKPALALPLVLVLVAVAELGLFLNLWGRLQLNTMNNVASANMLPADFDSLLPYSDAPLLFSETPLPYPETYAPDSFDMIPPPDSGDDRPPAPALAPAPTITTAPTATRAASTQRAATALTSGAALFKSTSNQPADPQPVVAPAPPPAPMPQSAATTNSAQSGDSGKATVDANGGQEKRKGGKHGGK